MSTFYYLRTHLTLGVFLPGLPVTVTNVLERQRSYPNPLPEVDCLITAGVLRHVSGSYIHWFAVDGVLSYLERYGGNRVIGLLRDLGQAFGCRVEDENGAVLDRDDWFARWSESDV